MVVQLDRLQPANELLCMRGEVAVGRVPNEKVYDQQVARLHPYRLLTTRENNKKLSDCKMADTTNKE